MTSYLKNSLSPYLPLFLFVLQLTTTPLLLPSCDTADIYRSYFRLQPGKEKMEEVCCSGKSEHFGQRNGLRYSILVFLQIMLEVFAFIIVRPTGPTSGIWTPR